MNDPIEPAVEQASRLAAGQTLDAAALLEIDPRLARGLQRLARIRQGMSSDAPVGKTWGHLQQLDFVARGGFGDVYRAYDPTLERTVALKLRRDDVATVVCSGRDLLAEARRLARVRHPHVLAVHGASYHDGRAGIWADWIEGETLQQHLLHASPSAAALVRWGRDLASALAAIHEAGLVHGDIKPGNIMRDAQGHIVLMDFGAGFASDSEGAVLAGGTPRYLAPEVMQSQAATTAIDIYALGVLLHWLGTRSYPLSSAVSSRLQPASLRRLVHAMLAGDPAARPSARSLALQFQHLEQAPLLRARRVAGITMAAALVTIAAVSTVSYRRAIREHEQTQTALAHAESTNRFLTDLIERASAGALGPTASLRDLLDSAPAMVRERFAQSPGDRSRLLHLIADVESSLSNDEVAAQLASDAAAAAVADDAVADNTLLLLGEAFRLNSRTRGEDSIRLQTQALLARARSEQRSARVVAHLEFCLAEVEYAQALRQSTAAAQQRLFERVKRLLSTPELLEPFALSLLWRHRANLEVFAGDYNAALVSARRSVAVAEAAFGSEHPRTAISRSVLGWLLLSSGHAGEAEQLFRSNIEMHEKKAGRDSRIVVDYRVGLAYSLYMQGRHAEAMQLAGQALPVTITLYGPLHRNTIDASLTLAQAQLGNAAATEASQLLTDLRARMLAGGQNVNRQYLQVLELLASARLATGDTEQASRLLDECASVGAHAMGPDNALTLRCGALHSALHQALAVGKAPRDLDTLLEPDAP